MTSSHPQVQWEGYSSCSVPEAQGTENDTHRHGDGETSSWVVVECVDVVGSGVDGAWAESQFVYICAGFPAKGQDKHCTTSFVDSLRRMGGHLLPTRPLRGAS